MNLKNIFNIFRKKSYYETQKIKYFKLGFKYELQVEDWWVTMDFKERYSKQIPCMGWDKFLYFETEENRTAAIFLI